jgi:hypothetical protein
MNETTIIDISQRGYDIYRNGIHMNCITGIIHGLLMPVAVSLFFCILLCFEILIMDQNIYNMSRVKIMLNILGFVVFLCYILTHLIAGLITVIMYLFIIHFSMFALEDYIVSCHWGNTNRYIINMIVKCFMWLFIVVAFMEVYSHWIIEHGHSSLYQFLNSLYWTPLYGTLSFYYPFVGQCI